MRIGKQNPRLVVVILCAAALAAAGCTKIVTDPKEVEKSPQAVAYRAYVRAILDGNWLDIMRDVTSDVSQRLEAIGGSEQHLAMFRESLRADSRVGEQCGGRPGHVRNRDAPPGESLAGPEGRMDADRQGEPAALVLPHSEGRFARKEESGRGIVSSRRGPVEMKTAGAPAASSRKPTYRLAAGGRSS